MSVTRTRNAGEGQHSGAPRGGPRHEEQTLIDALFPTVGVRSRLPSRDWKRLFDHLRDDECRVCQDYFAERRRQVLGDAELVSDYEIEAIVDSVAADGEVRSAAARSANIPGGWGARIRWVWAGGGLAVAAVCAAFVLYPANPFRRESELHERAGGVSAELYCVKSPENLTPLTASESFCPPDAQVVARAIAAPRNSLPHLTIVTCDEEFRCQLLSGSSFDGKADLVAAGPRMKDGERLRLFAIWSREPLSQGMLQRAAAKAQALGKSAMDFDALPLVPSCPQMAFTVHARSTLPR
jgi:hypothetical protein